MSGFRLAVVVAIGIALVGPALADEDEDTTGRWLGSSNEAIQQFGEKGASLGTVTAKSFVGAGTGHTKRELGRAWNSSLDSWRTLGKTTKDSLPVKAAPALFAASDFATSTLAPALEGDGKGAVTGAVNAGVSSLVAAQGAAAGAKLFGAVGGAVGSFFPVVGTAAGTIVGGAIGSIAGGFAASYAYDRYGKDVFSKVMEKGLSSVFDPDPLQEAMRAREDYLLRKAMPEISKNWDYNISVGASYGQEETQLFKPLHGVYQPGKPQQPAAPPPPQDMSVLQNASVVQLVTWIKARPDYKLPWICRISGTSIRCSGSSQAGSQGSIAKSTFVLQGTLQDNTISGPVTSVVRAVISNGSPCKSYAYEYHHDETLKLAADGSLTGSYSASTGRLTENNCPGIPEAASPPGEETAGTWRVLE